MKWDNSRMMTECKTIVKISIIWLALIAILSPYSRFGELSFAKAPQSQEFNITEVQGWKLYLYSELLKSGLNHRDFVRLSRIAYCESRWRQYDSQGEILRGRVHSPDLGIFQINTAVHEVDVSTPEKNIDYAIQLYLKKGTKDWVCKG